MKNVKVPERMCIACREMKNKKDLLRVVKTPEGEIKIDFGGRQNGRGAYLCRNIDCLQKAIKSKALERALKVSPNEGLIKSIKESIESYND